MAAHAMLRASILAAAASILAAAAAAAAPGPQSPTAQVLDALEGWFGLSPPTSEEPPEDCGVPGTVPGPEGACAAPRVWALSGQPPRLGIPTHNSFTLRRQFGQPDVHREKLQTGVMPEGRVELRSLFISAGPNHANCYKKQKEGNSCLTWTVAEVTNCSEPCQYPVGTRLMTTLFWKELQLWPVDKLPAVTPSDKVLVLPSQLPPKVEPSHYLGVLGTPGWTAYSSLFRIGNVACPGETVLISGAAGVHGSLLGQMAKVLGCRVVGTAGSAEKLRHLKQDLGFDEVVNHNALRTADAMWAALSAAAPEGIDFYFDNTAGHVTTAAWSLLRDGARVAICAASSHKGNAWWHFGAWHRDLPLEEDGSAPVGPTPWGGEPVRAVSRGRRIIVHALGWPELQRRRPFEEEFYERVPAWISEGKLKVHETILEGFESFPDAFIGLFTGANTGDMVVKLTWPEAGKPNATR